MVCTVQIMKLEEIDGKPVIKGNALELGQIANAAMAAVIHKEAAVTQRGMLIIGFMLEEDE